MQVVVNDRMQRRYMYELTEPVGKHFDPRFRPDLTPKQLLQFGVFGGVYMRDCIKEFPVGWFTRAKFQEKGKFVADPKLNYFGVHSSQPLAVWRKNGWIRPQDPR